MRMHYAHPDPSEKLVRGLRVFCQAWQGLPPGTRVSSLAQGPHRGRQQLVGDQVDLILPHEVDWRLLQDPQCIMLVLMERQSGGKSTAFSLSIVDDPDEAARKTDEF